MHILDIVYDSIVDGVGLRTAIFFSGCSHRCHKCHNPQSWDIENGKYISNDQLIQKIYEEKHHKNVTLSGGDPFYQVKEVAELARQIKKNGYNIWIYSGYTFEEILKCNEKYELLRLCDILVDGKFENENRNLKEKFKGSINQRIIDIQKSIEKCRIVERYKCS